MSSADGRADLHIRLKRHRDASASLTLTRKDGSVTWQRQKGALALVFPQHDLTHYAVETTLNCRGAFFGLIADGWELSDFGKPYARGPIPSEVREVEMLVGLFEGRRPDTAGWRASEINLQLQQLATDSKFAQTVLPRTLTDADVASVRDLRASLLDHWQRTDTGDALELEFTRS